MKHKTTIWMPFYPGDYLKKTMFLNTTQHGAYLLLMLSYWENVGPLPDDDETLASIVKLDIKSWLKIRPIMERFFDLDTIPGEWVHHRIDEELLKAFEQKQRAINRGKKGAEKRWSKDA